MIAPLVWGAWVSIASHAGSVTYTISYRPLGDTLVLAQVRYYAPYGDEPGGRQVVKDFTETIRITTSNSYANIEVRFKGIVLGSAVEGTISP